jgi:hypothetical protein
VTCACNQGKTMDILLEEAKLTARANRIINIWFRMPFIQRSESAISRLIHQIKELAESQRFILKAN